MAELPKLYIDNPGGDWLQSKLKQAQKDYQTAPSDTSTRKVGAANITGYFREDLDLSPDLLKDIPGALGEEDYRESGEKLNLIEESIQEEGYKPSPILVFVREDGQPFIIEGNHRVVEAVKSGRDTIPVELRYLRGAEDVEGPLSVERLRQFYESRPTETADEPRPSQLPALLGAASAASQLREPGEEPRPTGKGPMWSGIGGLKQISRRMFPIITAVQQAWPYIPDEYKQNIGDAVDWLKETKTHELFGLDKSGLEYFKELMTPTPEEGIGTLPEAAEAIPLPDLSPLPINLTGEMTLDEIPIGDELSFQSLVLMPDGKFTSFDTHADWAREVFKPSDYPDPDVFFGSLESIEEAQLATGGVRASGFYPKGEKTATNFEIIEGQPLTKAAFNSIKEALRRTDMAYIDIFPPDKGRGDSYVIEDNKITAHGATPINNLTELYSLIKKSTQYAPTTEEGIGSLGGMAVEKTPEFKKWFSRSHVADSPTKEWNRGKPKLVYHGSNLGEEYDDSLPSEGKFLSGADKALGESQWMTDLGAWFTEDPDVAAHFAGTARKDVSPQIYPAYLSLQNPMYFDTYEDLEEAFDESGLDNVIEWVEALQAKDWDGIIIENSFTDVPTRRTDYVAFKPTQIKSQFNVGTFDPEDADISKASGGIVTLPEFAEGGWAGDPMDPLVGLEAKLPVVDLFRYPPEMLAQMDKERVDFERLVKEGRIREAAFAQPTLFENLGMNMLGAGVTVFHGGPSRWLAEKGFPKGRPRLDRVGTGEGAQAYGHGFYSAEAKGVAQDYERRLTGGFDDAEFWPKALDIDMDRNEYDFLKSIAQISIKDPDVVTRDFTSTFPQWQKRQGVRKASATEELHDLATEMIAAKKEGSLKKLDIPDEDIVKFLDWDAPLSEQPESVRAALKGVEYLHGAKHSFEGESLLDEIQYIRDAVKSDPRGEFLHGALESVLGERGTSEYLEKLGIPGLKYYDQMSRGGKEGTRNYVVWDQDVLDRTKVYAQGGFVEKPVFRGVGHFMKNPVQSLFMGA